MKVQSCLHVCGGMRKGAESNMGLFGEHCTCLHCDFNNTNFCAEPCYSCMGYDHFVPAKRQEYVKPEIVETLRRGDSSLVCGSE